MAHFSNPHLADYYRLNPITVTLGDRQILAVIKASMTHWDQSQPLLHLLVTHISGETATVDSKKILILGCGNGIAASYLAMLMPGSQIFASDLTTTSIELTYLTALANQLQDIQCFPDLGNVETFLTNLENDQFDIALMVLPKGRKIARRWLLQAYQALREGGIFFLLGANDDGVQAVAKDASYLFSDLHVQGYKKGNRIYRARKTKTITGNPDWTNEPGIMPGTWNSYHASLGHEEFTIHTLPGVFSFDNLDPGTQLLLDSLTISSGEKILDMGCGCGVIGIAASRAGAGEVHLADNHIYSLASALENIRLNHIPNAQVFPSDLFSNLQGFSYDAILSNPPFHSGTSVDYQIAQTLIAQGHQVLTRGGRLVIVANRFIPYNRIMLNIFNNVKIVRETTKFYVLMSNKE